MYAIRSYYASALTVTAAASRSPGAPPGEPLLEIRAPMLTSAGMGRLPAIDGDLVESFEQFRVIGICT